MPGPFDPDKLSRKPGSATGNQLFEIKTRLNRIGKNTPRDLFDFSANGAYKAIAMLRAADEERRRPAIEPSLKSNPLLDDIKSLKALVSGE